MSRVEEIELALQELTPEEFSRVAHRVREIEEQMWDAQLERDAAEGRLEFLREEARSERDAGLLKDWPPACQATSGRPRRAPRAVAS